MSPITSVLAADGVFVSAPALVEAVVAVAVAVAVVGAVVADDIDAPLLLSAEDISTPSPILPPCTAAASLVIIDGSSNKTSVSISVGNDMNNAATMPINVLTTSASSGAARMLDACWRVKGV